MTAAGTANGTQVQLYDCNGTGAQQWNDRARTAPWSTRASGKCLDATGPSSANGTRLQIWDCTGAANQQWTTRLTLLRPLGSSSPPGGFSMPRPRLTLLRSRLARLTTLAAIPLTAAASLFGAAPAAHAAVNPGPGFPAHYAAPYVETWGSTVGHGERHRRPPG